MARALYTNIASLRDAAAAAPATNALKPLANIQVTVKVAGTNTNATIYQARTGAATGPDAMAGATGTNPFTTGPSGSIAFWAESGEYDIVLTDTQVPARITSVTIGWSAVSGAAGGIPPTQLATLTLDKVPTMDLAHLPAIIKSKLDAAVQEAIFTAGDLKFSALQSDHSGWLICDGRALSRTAYATLYNAISTRFGTGDGSTTFNVPDLRGRTAVGLGTHADVNAMGDNEGSQTVSSRTPIHSHTVNSHSHTVDSHIHGLGGHTHNFQTTEPHNGFDTTDFVSGGAIKTARSNHIHQNGVTFGPNGNSDAAAPGTSASAPGTNTQSTPFVVGNWFIKS